MGPYNKISAPPADDFDIQALVDSQLGWEDEKRVWQGIENNPSLRKRYDELVSQKKLLLQWWAGEGDARPRLTPTPGKRETLLV